MSKAPRPPTWQEIEAWLTRTVLMEIGPFFSHSGKTFPANDNPVQVLDGDGQLTANPQGDHTAASE